MDAFQEPVMPLPSVNARTSSADWKPEEIVIVADSMLVSSKSVIVKLSSITVAPSFSVKASMPAASEIAGAELLTKMLAVSLALEKIGAADVSIEEAPLAI